MEKTRKNFRLSEVAQNQLEVMAKMRGVTETAIVEMAIRSYAKTACECECDGYAKEFYDGGKCECICHVGRG